jgi:4-amino-4-deoxy-L-arabinose transferase-like glycosyltransferase
MHAPGGDSLSQTKVMNRRTYSLVLAGVLLVGLALRLWLWLDQGRAGAVYPADQDEYYRGAIHILLESSYYDAGQWLRPPGLPIFLAGVFALVGIDVARAMLVQCLLSVATLLLLAELARTLFNSRRAGVAAAAMGAVFLPYASYASQLLSETLFIFTIAAALLIFTAARQRGMPWRWVLAGGLMWGVATLTRPVGLYAVPLLLLWAGFGSWQAAGRTTWKVAAPPVLALLVGVVAVVAPWTARNYAVHGHLIIVDTNGGISFWLGNLREPEERQMQFIWNRTIPNLAEREQAALDRALDNIQREPLTFLARTRNKAVSLWQFDTRLFVANAPIGITLDERALWFAALSDAEYVALMILAVVGVVLARRPEISLPLLAWPLYGTLLSAVSLGHPRLRLPLLVAMFVYAALPLAHPREVWARLRAASWQRRGVLLAALVALVLVWYARVYAPFIQSQWWLARARLSNNLAFVERAIDAMPDNYLPYTTKGDMLRARSDTVGALLAYEHAAERAPQNTYVHAQRLDLYRHLDNAEQAQNAMHTIAAVGWNNNMLYRWAWDNLPAASGPMLDVGAPAPGIMRGVYAPERDEGRAFRWTMERAQLRFVAPEAERLLLELRAPRPATPVEVFYQGHHVADLQVGTDWQEVAIPLPASSALPTDVQVVELRAPTYVRSTAAPYPRGVALARVRLE